MKKILLGILLITIGIFFFLWWAYYDWKSYNPYEEKMDIGSLCKSIILTNGIDSMNLLVITHFKYDDKDLNFVSKEKRDILYYFNNVDTFYLNPLSLLTEKIKIPILLDDSTAFPKSFKVEIYYQNQLLKELDYDSFRKYAIPEYMTNDSNFLTANQWTLVIDSTLLELK